MNDCTRVEVPKMHPQNLEIAKEKEDREEGGGGDAIVSDGTPASLYVDRTNFRKTAVTSQRWRPPLSGLCLSSTQDA